MRIFAISLIKNEADIIKYSLTKASKWADKVFVYDNGSTDETWQIVNDLAKANNAIVPWKSQLKPYSDGLRAEVFNEFRYVAAKGDWWCFILDADELYIDEPREFLRQVPPKYHVVKTESFEYKLTIEDVAEYDFENRFPEDLPKIKYYSPGTYSERRFFRHRDRLVWPLTNKFPDHVGIVYPKGIRLKHFQYRSPDQVKQRVATRIQATKDGYKFFKKDNVETWKNKLVSRAELIKETPEFKRKYYRDSHILPWYRNYFRIIMHTLGVYP